jgi:hypothetical protein
MELVDSQCEDGVYFPTANEMELENWAKIRTCIGFIYLASDPERSKALDKVDEFQNYFVHGGPFYRSLAEHSVCVDWCCRFAMSDPFDVKFQSLCDDHDHTERDRRVIECDELFRKMINDSEVMVAEKVFSVTATVGDEGATIKGVVQHFRSGSVCIKTATDGSIVNVSWEDTDLNPLASNLLLLTDSIRACNEIHLGYRRNFYQERSQSFPSILAFLKGV